MTARFVLFALAICVGCSSRAAPFDPKAGEVIQLTRTTRATYSVYSWRSMEGSAGDWSAEFNRGTLHRVENSINRIVANCAQMTGVALELTTGNIDRGDWTAKVACGIQSLTTSVSTQWGGRFETPFGTADRVVITDDVSVRMYDILSNGAIAASTYHRKSDGRDVLSKATDVSATLPDGDLFSESSLQKSVVPDRYKVKPTGSERGR